MISKTRKPRTTGRFALSASLIVAIWSLLAFTASASADVSEIVDAVTTAPTEAVEAPAPTVEPQPVQTAPVAAPKAEPAEVEAPVVTTPADTAPISTPPVRAKVPVSVPSAPAEVGGVVRSVRDTTAAATEQAEKLVEGKDTGGLVPRIANTVHSAQASLAADSLLQKAAGPLLEVTTLAQGALDSIGSIGSTAGKALLPSAGSLLPEPREVSVDGPLGSPLPPPVSFIPSPLSGASPLQRPTEFRGIEGIATRSGALSQSGGRAGISLSPAFGSNGGLATTTSDRSGSPNPVWVPLPAPNLPGAPIASGSGGSSFAPIAALLALLALVAPAVLRRLGEVPDFRPLTPFACALERPG